MGFLGPAVLHGLGTIPSNDHAKGKLSSAQFCALIVRQPLVGCRILMLSKSGTIGQSEDRTTRGQGIKVMRPDCKE